MVKVSILITVYNCAEYLKNSIKTALNQNFEEEYEIIIVNDASPDSATEILEEYKDNPMIRVITHEKNKGLPEACNTGVIVAKGEYLIRLDADDYFGPQVLKEMTNVLDNNKDIVFVYSDFWVVNPNRKVIKEQKFPEFSKDQFMEPNEILQTGMMFRRNFLKKIGFYDPEMRCHEDYDLLLRFMQIGYIGYHIPKLLFYYTRHEKNMTTNIKRMKEYEVKIKKKHDLA